MLAKLGDDSTTASETRMPSQLGVVRIPDVWLDGWIIWHEG